MKQITCDVISDLLELYADEVVSEDTKNLVNEHLSKCADCKNNLLLLKKKLSIPAETTAEPIIRIKKRIKKKNIVTSIVSIIIVASILLGAFSFITRYKVAIPYEKTHIINVEQGNNEWEIIINYIDNIDGYALISSRVDNTTVEYYLFFHDTYFTRYFSNRAATGSYISIPAYEQLRISPDDDELTEVQTVKIYYCVFNVFFDEGKVDFTNKYLLWER